MNTRSFQFEPFADYRQIYLQDGDGEYIDQFSDEDISRMLSVESGTICILTARNTAVPFSVTVVSSAPNEEFTEYDQVNECSIDITTGALIVTDLRGLPLEPSITLDPGWYRVRVYYKNLNSLHSNGLRGDDSYQAVLWPGPEGSVAVLKQRAL